MSELHQELVKIARDHAPKGLTVVEDLGAPNADNLTCINGALADGTWYSCDYCHQLIQEDEWLYCYDCNKDMCPLCYDEKSEEIALKNGAQNYHLRKDNLEECRAHNLQTSVGREMCYCDVCDEPIALMSKYYSDVKGNYDVCLGCSSTVSVDHLTCIENDLFFGPLEDWQEIVVDEYDNAILCNINAKSPYYKKFAFRAVDGHGRAGYFTAKDTDFGALLDEYDATELYDEETNPCKNLEGKLDINCKLALMMLKRRMKTYFG